MRDTQNGGVLWHPEGEGPAGSANRPETSASSAPTAPTRTEPEPTAKIRAFEPRLGVGAVPRAEERWVRQPTLTGRGATHVKSFHCKLGAESLEFLDRQINEWLDAHPQYEVKFVTTAVGEWQGKVREPNLIVQVWV